MSLMRADILKIMCNQEKSDKKPKKKNILDNL